MFVKIKVSKHNNFHFCILVCSQSSFNEVIKLFAVDYIDKSCTRFIDKPKLSECKPVNSEIVCF